MSILYPDVPIAPGVPPVLRQITSYAAGIATQVTNDILSSDDVSGDDTSAPQWGIFDSDLNPVITGDSTIRVRYVHEFKTSDYPIEQGGFQSYNKVQLPYEVQISFVQGGQTGDVTDFLTDVETTLASLDLYTVVTPEVSYGNMTLQHMDYDRSAEKGAQLLPVDIWSREIRIAVAPAFSTTANPQGADIQPAGQVQATTPTTAQSNAAAGGTT